MEDLLEYYFETFISEKSAFLLQILTKNPIKIATLLPHKKGNDIATTNSTELTPFNLLQLQYWICKGYLRMSPTKMEVEVCYSNVFFYGRQLKIRSFVQQNFSKLFFELYNTFVIQQMLPFILNHFQVNSLFQQSLHKKEENNTNKELIQDSVNNQSKKIKKNSSQAKILKIENKIKQIQKKQQQKIDYSFFIYEYSNKISVSQKNPSKLEAKYLINIQQLSNFIRAQYFYKQISCHHLSAIQQMKQKKQSNFIFNAYFIYKSLKFNEKDSIILKQLICKLRYQKIQQFLLNKFQQYSAVVKREQQEQREEEEQEGLKSADILLIFNLIRKHPFLNEKELLQQSFLQKSKLQKCLNTLIKEGLISSYPDLLRTLVFRAQTDELLISKCTNQVAKAMHNLLVASSNSTLQRKDYARIESAVSRLDDFLIFMGY